MQHFMTPYPASSASPSIHVHTTEEMMGMMGMVLFAALAVVSARSPNGLCAPKDKYAAMNLSHTYAELSRMPR